MRTLSLLLLLFSLQLQAVTIAPTILRACINNTDSTVTLSWTSISDACGSFVTYSIYGNENFGAFKKIAAIPDINIKQHSYKLNNLNAVREYYITVLYLCDGADSVLSNTIKIDQSRPDPPTVLDSVSFDLTTQQIIAGWTKNSSADAMGYRLYRLSGGINDSIGQTANTQWIVSSDPNTVFDVTISVFDSCNLFAAISNPHRPTVLSSSIDSCLNEIYLNWSLYKGWGTIDSQALFVNYNNLGFKRLTSFNGSTTSYTFNQFNMGDGMCFYIRSYTSTPRISSSSNIRCIQTRKLVDPQVLYLRRVSVLNDQDISINFETDNNQDIKSYSIYRSMNGAVASLYTTLLANTGVFDYGFTDLAVDVHSNSYSYQIAANNSCDVEVLSSNKSNSILLKLLPPLEFNSYQNWDGSVNEYQIQQKHSSGSTWNNFAFVTSPGQYIVSDTASCYRIEAIENINSFGYFETSISNEVCIEPGLKVYAPNSMVLSGTNNRFIVKGQGIDYDNSVYEIYNRWGELIVQNRVDIPWYGDYMGEIVLTGVYVYVVKVRGLKGESETLKGVLRIIE